MITPKPKSVLELFDGHPERWTKGQPFRDEANLPTTLDKACSFCLYGAIEFVYSDGYNSNTHVSNKLLENILKTTNMYPSKWNDAPERTFEDVLNKVRELNI